MHFITTLLATLLAFSAYAQDDCTDGLIGKIVPFQSRSSNALKIDVDYSYHSLKSFEELGERNIGYFAIYSNSRKILLVAKIENALAQISKYLERPSPGDERVPLMKRVLEHWHESGLLEKLRATVDFNRLRPDGRPYRLLTPNLNEEIASVRAIVTGVQPLRAYRSLTLTSSTLAQREAALKTLFLQTGLAMDSLKNLRDHLNLKEDDLESVERLLDFIKADLGGNLFFKYVLSIALRSPDLVQRNLGQALVQQQSRLEIMSWYIRNRGLN